MCRGGLQRYGQPPQRLVALSWVTSQPGGAFRFPVGSDMMSRSDRALGPLEAIRGRAPAASGGPAPGTPRGTFPGEGPVISKRAVTAAAVAATTAVLLASGDAYACSIGDFTAKATCDTSTGEARAAITITDKDPPARPRTSPCGSGWRSVPTAKPSAPDTSTTPRRQVRARRSWCRGSRATNGTSR